MKNILIFLLLLLLVSCVDEDFQDPVLVELNRSLSGEWKGVSFLKNDSEEFLIEIDSFLVDFEIDTFSTKGFLTLEIKRSLMTVRQSTTQVSGYSLIDESSMKTVTFDSVRFSIRDSFLTLNYVNNYGDNIELLAVSRE